MEYEHDIFIPILERLLAGEDTALLAREFPQFAADIDAFAQTKSAVALSSETPSRDSFERMLGSVRAKEVAHAQRSFSAQLLVWSRLALPLVVILIALGGYSYLRQPAAEVPAVSPTAMTMSLSQDTASSPAEEHADSARTMSLKMAAPVSPGGTILFLGDAMFDRTIRTRGERDGYASIVASSTDLLSRYDLLVFNLEGPITNNKSVSEGSVVGEPNNYTFTFSPKVADFLAGFHVALDLGNNHTQNFGVQGVIATMQYLDAVGASYFGAPGFPENKVFLTSVGSTDIALVSYNEFYPDDLAPTLAAIGAMHKEGRFVIVYTHWGEEYVEEPAASMRSRAKAFVDAGASLVIGAHPHVVIPEELIEGVPVYFSLGNFIFDQYWNRAVRCGLAVGVSLEQGTLGNIEEIPVSLHRDGTTHVGGEAALDCAK